MTSKHGFIFKGDVMKGLILSTVLFLFATTASATEGLVSISKNVQADGKASYELTAKSCSIFAGISPIVEQISESSVIVKLEVFGPKCRGGKVPTTVKFYLGTFEHEITDLGLDPKDVTIFFNL